MTHAPRDLSKHDLDSWSENVPDEHQSVTVVVPCYNEEEGLPFLAEKLAELKEGLGKRLRLSVILVDDGSTDGTWDLMHTLFKDKAEITCLRHLSNRGIAAASATGIAAAEDEAVAVIDSDCSYDPALLASMIPLLEPDISLVTASPYHAEGRVQGVPRWRLFLSHGASWGYRQLLRNNLATYTSCFRLYRRSAVVSLSLRDGGFTGVAEMLVLLDHQGWRIVEVPAVLETRRFGQSKMRLARVIRGHLALMTRIAMKKLPPNYNRLPDLPAGHPSDRGRK